jgi:hypothetical protein
MWSFASFWGVFGHMNVFMPTWIYQCLAVVCVGSIVGCALGVKRLRVDSQFYRDVTMVAFTTLALVLLAFLQFNMKYFQAQGRYVYPALLPLSLFWAIGAGNFLPVRSRYISVYITAGIMIAVQIVALLTCIVPEMPGYSM